MQKYAPLLIIAAGLLVYYNSLTAPFVFDDVNSIIENPSIHQVWTALLPPHGMGSTVEGRPVFNLSLAVNYALGGLQTVGYHELNLLIHILAALTLYEIARRTLKLPRLAKQFAADADILGLAIALIWMVHPLLTESVTYVSQRAESLMGLFYLLTLYCFLRGVESGETKKWYRLSVAACLLGMGTKEVMASAPLIVLLYDRTFLAGTFREAWRQRKGFYGGLAATWLALAYLVVTNSSRGGTAGFGTEMGWWPYALTQCRAIVLYLKLSVWPHPLIFDYGMGQVLEPGSTLPYALILAALVIGTVVALWRRPMMGFLGAWFFAILAPSSSVVPVASQTIAEHRMYLPLVAMVAAVVLGIYTLIGLRSLGMFLALAVGLGWTSVRRNEDYRSAWALWSDTLRKLPGNPRVYLNLGYTLFQEGHPREAIQEYDKALEVDPNYFEVYNNLGITWFALGDTQQGLKYFQKAVQLKPKWGPAHYNLGYAFERVGRVQEAISEYQQTLQLDPDFAAATKALARLQSGQKAIVLPATKN